MAEPNLAIALRYDRDRGDLPRVSAKGRGAIAAQIVAIARAHGIEVRRDEDLAAVLETLRIDSPIPVAAFAAVAEILAHLYRANQQPPPAGAAP
jgi:flagellar biosynthesis protein